MSSVQTGLFGERERPEGMEKVFCGEAAVLELFAGAVSLDEDPTTPELFEREDFLLETSGKRGISVNCCLDINQRSTTNQKTDLFE